MTLCELFSSIICRIPFCIQWIVIYKRLCSIGMIQIGISEPIREDSDYNTSKEPTNPPWERIHRFIRCIPCKQALRGALAVGQEKEGELAITSLEFEYLHRKNRCEMLIGGDDISNDVITFGMCFSIFVYICTLSTSH